MSSKALIGLGAAAMLVLLSVVIVVWVAVIIAATKEPSGIQTNASSQKSSGPQETKGSAKASSKPDSNAQAKSHQALEDDLAHQEKFYAGLASSDDEAEEAQENFQIDLPPDRGKAKQEEAPASVPPLTDVATVVNAQTCNGASIELYAGEKRMLDLHNQTRAEHSLSPLCIHPALTKAARDHSQDMLDRDYFSHYSPEGTEPPERIKRSGYTSCGRTSMCGENLAVGSGYLSTPDSLFEGLMNSPGHRANILRKEFREVGIGLRTGSYKHYDGTASMYSVEFAGRPGRS